MSGERTVIRKGIWSGDFIKDSTTLSKHRSAKVQSPGLLVFSCVPFFAFPQPSVVASLLGSWTMLENTALMPCLRCTSVFDNRPMCIFRDLDPDLVFF